MMGHQPFVEGVVPRLYDHSLGRSRPRIMHGGVLGYDTQMASAGCWAIPDDVVEIFITGQAESAM